ncbi:hypothetical protein PYW08_009138 [Mythimna loreyi]|uniref:Uncharacterized protein n=1 Tax=Mythimna loreyi TaxID=667449 RepID=A0ACC2Q9L1_9NEOP|nr:hypothetical protein PYW08_009138 [Mythimna loreyi]
MKNSKNIPPSLASIPNRSLLSGLEGNLNISLEQDWLIRIAMGLVGALTHGLPIIPPALTHLGLDLKQFMLTKIIHMGATSFGTLPRARVVTKYKAFSCYGMMTPLKSTYIRSMSEHSMLTGGQDSQAFLILDARLEMDNFDLAMRDRALLLGFRQLLRIPQTVHSMSPLDIPGPHESNPATTFRRILMASSKKPQVIQKQVEASTSTTMWSGVKKVCQGACGKPTVGKTPSIYSARSAVSQSSILMLFFFKIHCIPNMGGHQPREVCPLVEEPEVAVGEPTAESEPAAEPEVEHAPEPELEQAPELELEPEPQPPEVDFENMGTPEADTVLNSPYSSHVIILGERVEADMQPSTEHKTSTNITDKNFESIVDNWLQDNDSDVDLDPNFNDSDGIFLPVMRNATTGM